MALGGFTCPFCGYYNANDATCCGKCERRLPPRVLAGPLRELLGTELWATKLLAGISVAVFTLQMLSDGKEIGVLSGGRLSTMLRFGGLTNGLEHQEPFRLLAACFVHLGVLHIAMNLIALADLGRTWEGDLGGARFVIAYVVTGIVGFLASALWYGSARYYTAGASGAVFGLDGVLLAGMAVRRDRRWKDMLVRTLIYSFVFYFALGTNQAAHIGGLVAGLVLGVLYGIESRPWRIQTLVGALAALGVLASIASIVMSMRSPVWRHQADLERARQERVTPRITPE